MVMPRRGVLSICSPLNTLIASSSHPARHATTGASVARVAIADAVVRDEHHPRVAVERRERHARRGKEVLADRYQAAWRGGNRSAREPGENLFLRGVQRFV